MAGRERLDSIREIGNARKPFGFEPVLFVQVAAISVGINMSHLTKERKVEENKPLKEL